MILNYTQTEYNEIIENLRNNGYTVTTNPYNKEEDVVIADDFLSGHFDIKLPKETSTYKDYSAIILWSLIGEDEATQTYSGISVPFTLEETYNDESVTCVATLSTEKTGYVRVNFELDRVLNDYIGAFGEFTMNFHSVMFIEGDGCGLSPDNSLVVPNLKTFFDHASGIPDAQLSLDGKTKLLSLGDDECCCIDSAFKCYEIVENEPTGTRTDVHFDGEYCFTQRSPLKLKQLNRGTLTSMVGFNSIEEMKNLTDAEIQFYAEKNVSAFTSDVTNCVNGCLYLKDDLIYPIAGSLKLQSNLRIEGNNATIFAFNYGYEYKIILDKDGKETSNSINIIENDAYNYITNVTFKNLNFKGRSIRSANQNNEVIVTYCDQGIKLRVDRAENTNFKFENVKFDGFQFSVHITGNVYPTPYLGWEFNNCEFVNSATPFMLNWTNGLTVRNSHVDASASAASGDHCFYLGCSTSNIIVDNCLLENAMGGAINQRYALALSSESLCHHDNQFTNLHIKNCHAAVVIGAASKDITVKNIFATNVARGLHLESCQNVIVDNFNASGNFYETVIRKDADGETTEKADYSGWCSIYLKGAVKATISNSYFKSGSFMFYNGAYEEIREDAETDNYVREFCTIQENFSEMMSEDNSYAIVSITFDNCIFDSTYTRSHNILGVSTTTDATKPNYYPNEKYCCDIDFNDCQFYYNIGSTSFPAISLYGDSDRKSSFDFNNCLVAYWYEDSKNEFNFLYHKEISPKIKNHFKSRLNDMYNDDLDSEYIDRFAPSEIKTMPKGYFLKVSDDAIATINNCTFYDNLPHAPYADTHSFIANSNISNAVIDSEKTIPKDLNSIK